MPPAEPSPRIATKWAQNVTPGNPLPEYPRPQFTRPDWQNLNGQWDYALADTARTDLPTVFADGQITVPFPYEAKLSGVGKPTPRDQRLWYRRTFTPPLGWRGQRLLLHFGAVNWDCSVYVNGRWIGEHRGGFERFTFDITDSLLPNGANELVVSAWNPVRADIADAAVVGKQRLAPSGIFYTAATGIWQTVWIEPVPAEAAIRSLKLTPDLDAGVLRVMVNATAPGLTVRISVREPDAAPGFPGPTVSAEGVSGTELCVPMPDARRWSPDDPFLYDLQADLTAGDRVIDRVGSYFGMRKVALGKDDQGRTRILLNNEFVFERGVLDQGYWPDGIYTAPTDEALRYDLEITKQLGFNLSRKHAKVEPDRWYCHADRLGLLVWQDMPQMYGATGGVLSEAAKAQFEREWRALVPQLGEHPSIVVWTTFNEGWGQHDTERVAALTKELDPTRLVNSTSGWTDKGVGDINDTHHYPLPECAPPEAARATVTGEFGGVGLREEGHMWNTTSWGYQGLVQSGWHATKRFRDLLQIAYRLKEERGMSAYVYTQLTDVESESNGLLTYDRAVLKLDAGIVAAANRGEFLVMPPNPAPDPAPTAQDDPVEWHYTTEAPDAGWDQPGFNEAVWRTGQAGFGHGPDGVRTEWTERDIWLRRRVLLPPVDKPERLVFRAFYSEELEIYVNGVLAAAAAGGVDGYAHLLMNSAGRAALRLGSENVIAVHCRRGTEGDQFIDVGIGLDDRYAGEVEEPFVAA